MTETTSAGLILRDKSELTVNSELTFCHLSPHPYEWMYASGKLNVGCFSNISVQLIQWSHLYKKKKKKVDPSANSSCLFMSVFGNWKTGSWLKLCKMH